MVMPENFLLVCSTPPPSRHSPLAYWTQELNGVSDPGTEPGSPALQADYLKSEPPGKLYDNKVYLKIIYAKLI